LIICLQGLTLFFILQNKTQHVYSPGDQLFERNKTDHILFCNCVIILYTLHVFRTIQIYIKNTLVQTNIIHVYSNIIL